MKCFILHCLIISLFSFPLLANGQNTTQLAAETFKEGRFKEVIKVLQRGNNYHAVEKQFLLAQAFRELGKLEQALSKLYQVLEKPHLSLEEKANIYLQLAETYLLFKNLRYDQSQCKVKLIKDPQKEQDDLYQVDVNLEKARKIIDEISNDDNSSELEHQRLLLKGRYYLQQKNFILANEQFEKVLKDNHLDPMMRTQALNGVLTSHFSRVENYKKASRQLEKLNLGKLLELLQTYKNRADRKNTSDENYLIENIQLQQRILEVISENLTAVCYLSAATLRRGDWKVKIDECQSYIDAMLVTQLLTEKAFAPEKLISSLASTYESKLIFNFEWVEKLIAEVDESINNPIWGEARSLYANDITLFTKEAFSTYFQLEKSLKEVSDSYQKAKLLLDSVTHALPHFKPAHQETLTRFLNQAKRIATTIRNNELYSKAIYVESQLAEKNGVTNNDIIEKLQSAIKHLGGYQFYNIEQPLKKPFSHYLFQISDAHLLFLLEWRLGFFYNQNLQKEKARIAYWKAYQYLQVSKDTTRYISFEFNERLENKFYPELLQLFFEQVRQKSGNDKQFLLKQIREIFESSKIVKLQNYFKEYCVTERHKKIDNIDQFLSRQKNVAAVYFFVMAESIEGIINIGLQDQEKTSKLYHFSASDSQLFKQSVKNLLDNIRLIVEGLEKNQQKDYPLFLDTMTAKLQSQQKVIYQQIISPLIPILQKHKEIDTLAIITDESLQQLPFSALLSPDGKLLIEEYAVVNLTGLKSTDFFTQDTSNARILLTGMSKAFKSEVGFFPALEFVPKELADIQTWLGIAKDNVLLDTVKGREFIVKSVEDKILENPYNIVHFATHGNFDSNPERTFIITAEEIVYLDQLRQILNITEYQPNPINLLTLSACETGVGDEKAAFGLAGTALKMGSRSVLATLWSVHDKATYHFISKFYKFLSKKNSKVKALQATQKAFLYCALDGKPHREPHEAKLYKRLQSQVDTKICTAQSQKVDSSINYLNPVFWSPFILIGNWL